MSLKLDYNIKQTKKIFSLLLLFGSLSHFVFIPFTAVKCFSPICYFLLNFLLDFFYFLNILLCCLRVWVESSCQKSSFDSFKCLTSSPNFCSFTFLFSLHLFSPASSVSNTKEPRKKVIDKYFQAFHKIIKCEV